MGCRFFFDQTRNQVNEQYPNVFKAGKTTTAKKIAAKKTIAGYGWLNSVYPLAKDGVFNLDKETPVNSVLKANLYEVLTYLSWQQACSDYEEILSDLQKK